MTMQQLLQELYEAGLTDNAIAMRIDAPQSIVHRLRKGNHRSTTFERGKKIADLHDELIVKGKTPTNMETSNA